MKKIPIDKNIFNDLISDEFIELFKKEYKDSSVSNNINYFIEKLYNFVKNIEKINLDEIINHINNPINLLQNNSISSISFCKKCNKNIKDIYQKGLSISFNPIMNNFFCSCDNPEKDFNINIFTINLNFLIFNVIEKIKIWWYELQLIIFKQTGNYSILNYKINSLLIDLYSSIDSLKFQIFIINENSILDEIFLNDKFYKDKKSKIKDVQNKKSSFEDLLKELQMKLNENTINITNILKKFNLICLNDNWEKNVKWIIDERNNISHNYLNLFFGNYINICLSKETYRLKIVILILIDFILLFYIIMISINNIY